MSPQNWSRITVFQPNNTMLEPYTLCRIYGVQEQKQCEMLQVKGIYNRDFTIYLRNDFDISDIEGRSQCDLTTVIAKYGSNKAIQIQCIALSPQISFRRLSRPQVKR